MNDSTSLVEGSVFNIQRFSTHDGPGIRTTVFLKGCPLRCRWCHNPESVRAVPELLVRPSRCIRCGACVEACAEGVAEMPAPPPADADPAASTPGGECRLCGACVEACPAGGREIVGRKTTARQLLPELLKDRVFFEESGGGVTFSGGEPLSQPRFLMDCLEACRASGLHTTVDTCGHAPREALIAVAEIADLVLFDLKLIDGERHERLTGVDNERILANLRALAAKGGDLWLRVPVVPGLNDDDENLAGVADLAVSLPGIRRVSLLPYHSTGVGKHEQLGRSAGEDPPTPPTRERMEELAGRFEAVGLEASIGG